MLTRRRFFASVPMGIAALGMRTEAASHAVMQQATSTAVQGYKFFTNEQVGLLEAILEQIIPSEEKYPGGKGAHVAQYIDNALTNWLPQNRWDYIAGLDSVDQSGRLIYGGGFAELTSDQQKAVLQRIEKGDVPGSAWASQIGQEFISLVVTHSFQGYYGDPEYGGNRNEVSWEMIGWMR